MIIKDSWLVQNPVQETQVESLGILITLSKNFILILFHYSLLNYTYTHFLHSMNYMDKGDIWLIGTFYLVIRCPN